MTSKPETVSQEAALAANELWHELAACAPNRDAEELCIARAIMAAEKRGEKRERECAAQDIENECARILSKQDGKNDTVDSNLRLIACILPGLAASIRKRGGE